MKTALNPVSASTTKTCCIPRYSLISDLSPHQILWTFRSTQFLLRHLQKLPVCLKFHRLQVDLSNCAGFIVIYRYLTATVSWNHRNLICYFFKPFFRSIYSLFCKKSEMNLGIYFSNLLLWYHMISFLRLIFIFIFYLKDKFGLF